jgi:hypothetical protein
MHPGPGDDGTELYIMIHQVVEVKKDNMYEVNELVIYSSLFEHVPWSISQSLILQSKVTSLQLTRSPPPSPVISRPLCILKHLKRILETNIA